MIVFEIGFDDGNDRRRNKEKGWSGPELGEVSVVVQMGGRWSQGFIGGRTDPDGVDILPMEPPFAIRALLIPPDAREHWTQTCRPSRGARLRSRLPMRTSPHSKGHLADQTCTGSCTMTRQSPSCRCCRMAFVCLCVHTQKAVAPRTLSRGRWGQRWVRLCPLVGGGLLAVEVEFGVDTANAAGALMQSFRQRRTQVSHSLPWRGGSVGRHCRNIGDVPIAVCGNRS